ncbi:MAG: alkaline phosphatase [Bacteroidota bacterium]
MRTLIIPVLLLGTLACTTTRNPESAPPEKPQNIIFLIGDGMGLSAVSASLYDGDETFVYDLFSYVGLSKTHSTSHKVTDSAASGTAMATGQKTCNGVIGVDTLKRPIPNITEVISPFGWSTGLVATSTITHATPASFYAHVESRRMEEEIALQLIDSEIDFFAGGGLERFYGRNDTLKLLEAAAENGFTVDTSGLKEPGSLERGKKYGFLLAGGAMPPVARGGRDFLPEATTLAIEQLSKDKKRFFLMVEGSQIDWAAHDNNTEYLQEELHDFEKAIAVAMDFAERDGNTLVLVTSDHETGGVTLSAEYDDSEGHSKTSEVSITYATRGHSATMVPVFAYGPGAEEFAGVYENSAIFHKMVQLVTGKKQQE